MSEQNPKTQPTERETGRNTFGNAAFFAAGFTALWAMLNLGDHKSWVVGLPILAAATVAAVALGCAVPRGLNVLGVMRFVVFFVSYSFRGGWDVARRAFSPAMPLNPTLLTYQSRLRDQRAQVLLVNVMSLLPGTVSAGLEKGVMTLHALDAGPCTIQEVRMLEDRIANLFKVRLDGERSLNNE
jgi:multicomponent Na+:H+ antiporter subunit E